MSDEQTSEGGIPKSIIIGGVSLAAVGSVAAGILSHQWGIVAVGVVLIILLVAIFLVIQALRKSGRSKSLLKAMRGFFDQVREGRDPQQLANLEELQRKFEALVKDFEAEKKDLYELPWYLIIGPSGSGKSWALRGCKKIQPLIEEDYSGPSAKKEGQRRGTLLMDWWRAPEAIILDTAGGTVFQEEFREDEAIDSPEWQLLLRLLKETRPACPINGVFVTIPAELLLLDEMDEKDLPEKAITLEQYAESLRHQLKDNLQGKLGVRFPVYFLVTKGDLIPGFREFADDLEAASTVQFAARTRDQILGWSNPEEIGKLQSARDRRGTDQDGFSPLFIGRYIKEITASIRRGRMALLVKYAGRGSNTEGGEAIQHRACDLFGFPSALEDLAPRLQGFMETVFGLPQNSRSGGGRSALPPFVRGIYFTSAMREGEVLDRVRAAMAGTTLANLILPGAKDRNTTKSFFLGDLFLQKSLMEGGLVTPNVEARKFVKSRRRALIWSGIGATCVLLCLVVVGGMGYSRAVIQTVEPWREVGLTASKSPYWLPVIEKTANGYVANPDNIAKQVSLSRSVDSGWARWLYTDLRDEVGPAQLALFEHGVVLPLAFYGRERLSAPLQLGSSTSADQLASLYVGGLLGLLELELGTNNLANAVEFRKAADLFVGGEMRFLCDPVGTEAVDQLKPLFVDTYTRPGNMRAWPTLGARSPMRLSVNVAQGISNLGQIYGIQGNQFQERREALVTKVNDISECLRLETALLGQLKSRVSSDELGRSGDNLRKKWEVAVKKMGVDSLQAELLGLSNSISLFYTTNIGAFRANLNAVHGFNIGTNEPTIVREIEDRVKALEQDNPRRIAELLNLGEDFLPRIQGADERALRFIAKSTGGNAKARRALDARLVCYKTLSGDRGPLLEANDLGVTRFVDRFFENKFEVSNLKQTTLPSVDEYPSEIGDLEIVRKYVDYLRFQEFTLLCADRIAKAANKIRPPEASDALSWLQDAAALGAKLASLEKKSNEVVPDQETLPDSSEEAEKLTNARTAITKARNKVRDAFWVQFKADCRDPIGAFLGDESESNKITVASVASGYKKFQIWNGLVLGGDPGERQNSADLNELISRDNWRRYVEADEAVYGQIYTPPAPGGRRTALAYQKYRISFDSDAETQRNIGIFRDWKFGGGDWIDGSLLTAKDDATGRNREFSAMDAVDIQVRYKVTNPKSARIESPPESVRSPKVASILFWINKIAKPDATDPSGTWRMPLTVSGENGVDKYNINLIISQVRAN